MKKHGIGSRLLAVLLALTMIVSVIPFSVFAADGDIQDGETGLDANINTLDTISWPIKVYDYLNDGLLFEYASAQDTSISNLGGDAYGGGEPMPGVIAYGGKILGSDFTVNSSDYTEYYDSYCYSHWLKAKSNYHASYAQVGSGTAGAFKYLRLQPYQECSDMAAMVISDFAIDNNSNYTYYKKYLDGNTSYPKERVRYAVLVYKTNVDDLELTLGMSTNLNGTYTIRDYNGYYTTGPDGYYVSFDLAESKYLKASDSWNYIVIDMKSGPNADVWDDITKVTQIILDNNMTTPDDPDTEEVEQYLDLSHIAYFSDKGEATRFGEAAKAFSTKPGYFLPDQYYTANGTSYSKHWNMGNNTAFTMLYANDGGGWNADNNKGGANSWANGYFNYQIGFNTGDPDETGITNSDRNTAKETYGYPVPDDIYFFNAYSTAKDLSGYDFGYTLYNDMSTGVMTAGLLQNDLVNVVGVDGKTYRIPQYKQGTVDYITYMVRNSLSIGQMDQYGNYNYNFVKGSPSSQFIVNGEKVDLATALRSAIGMKAAANNMGNYTYADTAKGTYGDTIDKTNVNGVNTLIGPYDKVKDNIDTFYDAAYYLLHNLFVDNSYNQLQDDYNYLVLSKAPVTGTGKEAYVFDAGFTTGNYESDPDSKSAVVYNKTNGTISLSSAVGKDEICYGGNNWTTRNPFLPVTDAEGDYGCTGTDYFREDGARTYADYGDTYVNRNYNYVMQANAEFIYHYQDDLFFQFEGDDDVYLFVNGELVLDIGAAHSITAVKMQMNDYVLTAQQKMAPFKQKYNYRPYMSDAEFEKVLDAAVAGGTITGDQKDEYRRWHHLNLVDGERYSIDFYYMERHGWGANMRVATNIVMTDPAMVVEKKAYQDGSEIPYGGVVDEDERIEYSFSVTNKSPSKLYNLTFDDYDIGISLSPEKGLVFHKEGINGKTVTDARGLALDVSDLEVQVDGYLDEELTKPVSIKVTFDGADPTGKLSNQEYHNELLKVFLKDLTSNDGTAEEETDDDSLYSGKGLWRDATVTIRGIYYKLTKAQIEAEQFNNLVFTTANPAVDSEIVLKSEDTHQVRLIGDAAHIYQWAGHPVYFSREDVAKWQGGTIQVGSETYTADEILITTCRKDGTEYDYPDIMVEDRKGITVHYPDSGTKLTFIKILLDTNKDGKPDDVNGDGVVNGDDYLSVLPLAVYGTTVKDDVVVLDYGLKAELTGKNGIKVNDYLTVPNLGTTYSIMGMTKEEPGYLNYTGADSYNKHNMNRISFASVDGNTLSFNDGTYEYVQEKDEDEKLLDSKLFFTPEKLMDETYTIYLAVTIHEDDITPSQVGTANTGTNGYDVDITKEVQMYHKITVLPATVMYYEDDFKDLSYNNSTNEDIFTHHGTGSDKLQQGVDQSENYGSDQVYQTDGNAQTSGNSLTSIKITNNQPQTSFTFKGTGFEIIGRTNAFDSASFVVTVKKDGKTIRNLPVITEFTNKDSAVCKHEDHKQNGHCNLCGTYVGHVYYQDVCSKCGAARMDYYLVGYINGVDYGCQDDWENLGNYKFVNGKLTTTFKSDSYVYVKTADNLNWFMTDGYPGTGTRSAFLYNTGMRIAADKLHVPGGVPLTFTLVENRDGTLTLSYTTADDDVTDLDRTVYFRNTDQWEDVYIYYWSIEDATIIEWPGEKMNDLGGGIYSYSLPADAQFVLFHNNAGVQTGDLTVPADNMIYGFSGFNAGWSAYNPGQLTLHFDDTVSQWGKVYAYYWNEEIEEMIPWPGEEMQSGTDNSFTAVIPGEATKIIFTNGNAQTADLTIWQDGDTYVFGTGWKSRSDSASTARTVFFENTAGWSGVYAYYWNEDNEKMVPWPGDAMELVEGNIYAANIPEEATHVVFNIGDKTHQTLNLELPESGNLFVYDKVAHETAPVSSWSVYGDVQAVAVADTTARAVSRTIYVENDTGWPVPYAYYWTDGGSGPVDWPGVAMTQVSGNRYKVEVPAACNRIIFSNKGSSQTADLILTGDKDLYTISNNTWSSSTPVTFTTIYLENDNGWSTPCAYYWTEGSEGPVAWPGVQMTHVSDNRYSVEVPSTANRIIFSDNGSNQTSNLNIVEGKDLFTLSTNVWSSSTGSDEPEATRTIYFDNNRKWTKVNVHFWSDGNNAMSTWPGKAMEQVEGNIYGFDIPVSAQYVIFNDGTVQTDNITIPADKNLFSISLESCGNWDQYEPSRTLFFNLNGAQWSKVYAYYWSYGNEDMTEWHGIEMSHVEGSVYSIVVPMDAQFVIFNDGNEIQTGTLGIGNAYQQLFTYHASGISQSATTRTIYYKSMGKGNVTVTYWGPSLDLHSGAMTLVKDDIYSYKIPMDAKYVVFAEEGVDYGDKSVEERAVILSDDHDLFADGQWTKFDPSAEYRPAIYFNNNLDWQNVHVYYWSESNPDMIAWPGVPMTAVSKELYTARIPTSATMVIFCEVEFVGEEKHAVAQTGDLHMEEGKDLFNVEKRDCIYFNNYQNWKNVHAYFWSDSNPDMTVWPGVPMTALTGKFYIDVPEDATKVVFCEVENGDPVAQTGDLVLAEGSDQFYTVDISGDWSKYEKPRTDAIHQIPTMRVDLSKEGYGEYEVIISGQPSYNVDWKVYNKLATAEEKQAYLRNNLKDMYLYVDGIRIYQPLGDKHQYYSSREDRAQFKELRNLILEGYASVAAYEFYEVNKEEGETETGKVIYSGNVSWTENRNGLTGNLQNAYVGNQVSSIDDYLLVGPNNETYLNGNAQTQAVIFFAKEEPGKEDYSLQIAARGMDAGLFMGGEASGVNATLYQGVRLELPDGTVTYGWKPIDTIVSGTEQYYTIDYTACPFTVNEAGERIYQVALYVRSGMVSFTSVKYTGLDIHVNKTLGDVSIYELSGGLIYDFEELPEEGEGSGTTGSTTGGSTIKEAAALMGSISQQMEAIILLDEEEVKPQGTIDLSHATLSFEDEIFYNIYYNVSDMDVPTDNMGLAIFSSKLENGTVEDAIELVPGAKAENGLLSVRSGGIAAKDLNETLYFKVYAQLSDGSYVYSPVAGYSARTYAKSILSGNESNEMKALVVAMLNYGAAAQQYFGVEGELLNAQLTAEQKALVAGYHDGLMNKVVRADETKLGSFAATGKGFSSKYPTVSFEGAFSINYYFTPSEVVQGNMKLYYWTQADYEAADQLTADNATGISTMTGLNSYGAAVKQIAAKDMDSTVYVAAVYSSNGETYCSGVIAYSLGAYCDSQATGNSSISSFAEAAAVYGAYAKSYFGK